MKLGLVTDVHGDHVSLAASLAHLRRLGADEIWCAGDVIDGEPFGEEVIALLRAEKVTCIRGNHERWRLEGFLEVGSGEELSREALAWLRELPARHAAELGGARVAMLHGDVEDVTAETDAEKLRDLLAKLGADVLVCGHTHDAFEARVGRRLVVNPGACCRLGQVFVRKSRPRRRLRADGPGCRPADDGLWLPAGPRKATFGVLELPGRKFEVFAVGEGGAVEPFEVYQR